MYGLTYSLYHPREYVRVGFDLCCFMIPGFSKDIRYHVYDHIFSKLSHHKLGHTPGPHMKRAVTLMIAYSHFNLPRGFVWVCMG